ncbi:30S ribosomal protein S16 [soil metagenome]
MPVKIRLQRHGKKGAPFFHIVVADSRAPRDGRFIERIGAYNPITDPATIELNADRATEWVMKGAQPSETAKAILSYKGVLYRVHLNNGVSKGSLTQEQADAKLASWLEEKTSKITAKKTRIADSASKSNSARLTAEAKVSADRADALRKKALEATFTPAAEEENAAPAAEESGEAPAEA